MNNKKILLLGFFAFALLTFSLISVSALVVGNVTFNNNASAQYDEGTFFVNWTNNSIDSSYRVFMFVNRTSSNAFFFMATNNSAVSGAGPWTYGINFTNTTQANYTFIIEAVNASGNTNSSNISMYADRTAPTITLPQYTNATAKKNTTTLTLNISVSDALSGLTGSVCLISANTTGANQSIAVSGGWCNSTSISLAGTADGNKTISVYVNDTVGILGLNNSFVVLADTTAPSSSASCTSTSIQTGDSFPCSCSGTDTTSGVSSNTGSSTSPNGISTPSSTGTFTYSCLVQDNAGNSASAATSYTVNQPPSSGSSSGSSSGAGTGSSSGTVAKSQSFTKVTPGVASIVKNFDTETGLKEIQINVKNEAQNVKVTVTKYASKPAAVSVEKTGKVFQYMQIKVDNVADKLDKATISTKVNKSWVSSNGLNKDNLVLSKFDETAGKWNELATTYKSEDSNYYYYDAEVTSFSYFAISEKAVVPTTTEGTGTTGTAPSGTTGTGITAAWKNNWVWWTVGVIAVLAIIGGVIYLNKKR